MSHDWVMSLLPRWQQIALWFFHSYVNVYQRVIPIIYIPIISPIYPYKSSWYPYKLRFGNSMNHLNAGFSPFTQMFTMKFHHGGIHETCAQRLMLNCMEQRSGASAKHQTRRNGTGKTTERIQMDDKQYPDSQNMVLVCKKLQNWVILGSKCWCAYSSTMLRIWDVDQYGIVIWNILYIIDT